MLLKRATHFSVSNSTYSIAFHELRRQIAACGTGFVAVAPIVPVAVSASICLLCRPSCFAGSVSAPHSAWVLLGSNSPSGSVVIRLEALARHAAASEAPR
jgi:hypothetical protein